MNYPVASRGVSKNALGENLMWEDHLKGRAVGMTLRSANTPAAHAPLLCVHGSGGSGASFAGMFAHLPPEIEAAALDLPGHGQTPGPSCNQVGDYAAWVIQFLRAGPQRPVLLGHSLGGAIALTVALEQPQLLSGLVLWGTGARLRVLPAIIKGLLSDPGPTLEMVAEKAFAPGADPALIALAKNEMEAAGPVVTQGDYSACDQFDVMNQLGNIKLPALVVVGDGDQLTPLKYSQYLVDHLAQASLAVIPGAGHMIQMEQPAAGARAVGEFILRRV